MDGVPVEIVKRQIAHFYQRRSRTTASASRPRMGMSAKDVGPQTQAAE